MEPEEVSSSTLQRTGAILVWVGAIGSVVVGLILGLSQQAPGGLGIRLALIPFLIVIVVGAFMLGGREQVEAAEELIASEGEEAGA
jgi:fucose permease